MTFDGLDKLIKSDTFQRPVKKMATDICNASHLLHDPEICPDSVQQYSQPLFSSMSRYLLGKTRWCNEILGVCTHMKVEQEDIHQVVDNILATKP